MHLLIPGIGFISLLRWVALVRFERAARGRLLSPSHDYSMKRILSI
jgi:hypothetical protein